MHHSTTIVATATPTGGAIAVVRLSGSQALPIVARYIDKKLKPRLSTFCNFGDVDQVVATYYPAPHSYTGEDCVEISCHGSSWITAEIVRLLTAAGAVAATAGEFTMRAFLGGKLDLTQAEAVADLIASDSRAAAAVALQQMRGGYSDELRAMAADLLDILSLLELELDFGEEDVEFADRTQLHSMIARLHKRVTQLAASFSLGNAIKEGVTVAIVGRPNVGKSTLLNRLVGEERSIVSPVEGTTRDYIEEVVTIDDIKFRFVDTAGLRTSDDDIERMGIERSYRKLQHSAVVLHLVESAGEPSDFELTDNQTLIRVVNKTDLRPAPCSDGLVAISAKTGAGVETLRRALVASVAAPTTAAESFIVTNARHWEALRRSSESFSAALAAISAAQPTEIISSDIRLALSQLREITGEITTTDILANIFSKFCIGK